MRRPAATLVLLVLAVPPAAADIGEVDLPEGARLPLSVAADGDVLWVTLDGTWALGAYDTRGGNWTLHPLAAPPASPLPAPGEPVTAPGDSLFALRKGPDGAWWTASQTHLHRVPVEGNATALPLPGATQLAGDVAFLDGKVLVALVTADAIAVVDPATGNASAFATPPRFGPLGFVEDDEGLLVTGTYDGALARVDLEGRRVVPVVGRALLGPVEAALSGSRAYVAEMGASSVASADLAAADGALVRWTTSPSPYYPSSGPSDVLVADGDVWFVEHFADRLAKLDPAEGTLVEWEVPSAPGSNVQHLARTADGRVWAAEWAKDKLVWVRDVGVPEPPQVAAVVHVLAGNVSEVPVLGRVASVATDAPALRLQPSAEGFAVDATEAAPGEYRVLVSGGSRALLVGRYATLVVDPAPEEPAPTPGAGVAAALLALALVAGRKRR